MPPHVKRWGHVGLSPLRSLYPLSLCLCVLSVCMSHSFHFCPSVQRILSCRRSNTRRQPNVGPPSTTLSNISSLLGYRVVFFCTTLNVGKRHRRRAIIKQTWDRCKHVLCGHTTANRNHCPVLND